jgi:hypothetical protein
VNPQPFSSGNHSGGAVLKSKFYYKDWTPWLGGLLFSCLPLFAVILMKYINTPGNYNNFWAACKEFWGYKEIFYMCVSLSVAALIKLWSISTEAAYIKSITQILLIANIILWAMVFAGLKIQTDVLGVDHSVTIEPITSVALCATLLFGTVSFIGKERG